MSEFCHSCTAPLNVPGFRTAAEGLCVHCVDERGSLKPREDVRQGIAGWLKSWQGQISDEPAYERAGHFMKAMPKWAE